jgi:D-serine deaminase-like pyridoxal phosphate-dependent protein
VTPRLEEMPLGLECKPFAPELASTPLNEIGGLGLALGDPRLLLPAMLLHRSALEHNLATMAAYCAERGLLLAPHGKTTMAPALWVAQLQAGAWGMTAATVGQAQIMHACGLRRIVIANEVVDPGALRWVAQRLDGDPELELLVLADSVAGVERMDRLLAAERPLDVLIEVGMRDRRAGQRSPAGARAVAEAVQGSAHLRLAGVECFEGVAGSDRADATLRRVDEIVEAVAALAAELEFETEVATLSAGGSLYFDRLGPLLEADTPHRVIARSGCYVTHDSGLYENGSPLALRAALEVWGEVLSRPEPDLAIVNVGRRDASFDAGLPVPQRRRADDTVTRLAGWTTTELNDQHAFLRGGDEQPLEVGDLVGFGISHPCTAFDKWRVIAVVDDDLRVVDAFRTFF